MKDGNSCVHSVQKVTTLTVIMIRTSAEECRRPDRLWGNKICLFRNVIFHLNHKWRIWQRHDLRKWKLSNNLAMVRCNVICGAYPNLRGWIRRYTQTIMPGSLRPLGLLLYVPSIYCRYIKKTGVNATTIYFLDWSYIAYWEPFIWQGMYCPAQASNVIHSLFAS